MKPTAWMVALAATIAMAAVSDDLVQVDRLFAEEGPTANVLHQYDRVVRDMERDEALDGSTKSQVYFKRGLIAHSLQKDQMAIKDFKKVVELDSGHNQAKEKLNELYMERGQWDEVSGMEDTKNQWNDLFQSAKDAFAAGDYASVVHSLRPVVDVSPNHLEANQLYYQAAKKLYDADKLATVDQEPVSVVVTNSLAHLVKIAPNDIQNYYDFSVHMLFNQVEVQASKNTARACLRINNEFKPCGDLSKFHNKFSDLLPSLEEYSILMGHYYAIDSQHEVEEPEIDWKKVHGILFTESVRKINRRDTTGGKNNLEYLRNKAEEYGASGSQFIVDLDRMACEAMIQVGNYKGASGSCKIINGPFLPRDIPEIDKLIQAKKFQEAKRILDQYASTSVGESRLFNDRYQKIDEWMQQRQRERQQQQQRQYQQQQQQQQRQYQQHQQQQRVQKPPKHDYYKILDVDKEADEKTIRKAYRTQTLKYHPDKAKAKGSEMSPEEAEAKMQEINKAYEVLSDKELRDRYDMGDDPNDPDSQGGGGFQGGNPFGGGHVNFDNIFQQFFQQQQQQQQQQRGQKGPRPKKRKKNN